MKNIIKIFKHPYFIWSMITLIAFIFFFFGVSHESLWCDEAFSAKMAEYNITDILKHTIKDVHPPLYYISLRLFRMIFGNSECSLRLLSVLGATGMVSLGAGPVRKLFDEKTAYIYALIVLFTPIIIIMAHEARMYSITMFTVTASALYGLLLLKESKIYYWIIFGISVLTSAYLHYYGLIAVFFINLLLIIWIIIKRRAILKHYIITASIIIFSYIPWLIFFIDQIKKVDNAFWIPTVELMTILTSFLQIFTYKNFHPIIDISGLLAIISTGLTLTIIITSIVLMIKNKENMQKLFMIFFFLSIYIFTLLTAIIISLVLAPILYHRYMIVCAGMFILPLCIIISNIKSLEIKIPILVFFILLNSYTIINIHIQEFNGLFYTIKNKYKDQIKPGDLIITSDCFCISPALYYFPDADHYFYVNNFEKNWEFTFDAIRPNLIEEVDPEKVLKKYKSFWYLKSGILSVNENEILGEYEGWEEVVKEKIFTDKYSENNFSIAKYAVTGSPDRKKNRSNLKIKIKGIHKKQNTLLWISIFDKDPVGDPRIAYRNHFFNAVKEDEVLIFKNIEYGEYALLIIHDENNNRRFDMSIFGKPKEGICAYNFDPEAGKPPSFRDMKFEFNESNKEIEIEMIYPGKI